MSFKVGKGKNRFDNGFKKEVSKVYKKSDLVQGAIERSLVRGEFKNSQKDSLHDTRHLNDRYSFDPRNRRSLKRINRNALEVALEKEEIRVFDHELGGVGGKNQDQAKLKKDKAFNKVVAEENKVAEALPNEWNTNEDAGSFTGGIERANYIKKNKLLEI